MEIGDYFTFEPAKDIPVHNWFYYKEAYSPQLVEWALGELGVKGGTVFDPFCGIGTTMLYAKEHGMKGIGIDVSPLALFVTKTKCADYSEKDAEEAERELKGMFKERKEPGWIWQFELFHPSRFFGKRNYNDIRHLRESIEEIENEGVGGLFLLALLSILPQVGFFIKDGGVLREEPSKSAMPVKDAFKRKVKRMVADLRERERKPETGNRKLTVEPELKLEDAREFEDWKADAFVTSPPYLNYIDYSKVYGLELSLLTMEKDSTKIMRAKEVRGFITGESFGDAPPEADDYLDIPIAGTYFADMERVLRNLKRIAPCGCMVVGNSVLGGRHIPVDEILIRIGERIGFSGRIAAVKERIADVRSQKIRTRESAILFDGGL
ncbi:MAG: DNA methyltransferase [Candidatus Micrarchaeota archaeon]